jgi:hypothetical protein
MTVRHIFEISEDDHPSLVTHARDIWWTLYSANAFVSPGVNSRGELVPSRGASRRRLGDYIGYVSCNNALYSVYQKKLNRFEIALSFGKQLLVSIFLCI